MTRYVALLRAINVGGHAVVKMTELNRAFAAAGCSEVRTVIASGNVLFESAARSEAAVLRGLQPSLRELFGKEVTVLIRTAGEIASIVKADPFSAYRSSEEVKPFVCFLCERPDKVPRLPLVWEKDGVELFRVKDREAFFVRRPRRDGTFAPPKDVVEKELGVAGTTRNWSTVVKIAGLLSA